jgi:hypothetical protein
MKAPLCILLAAAAGLGVLREARADVYLKEPSTFSIEGSDVIVVATVQAVKGKPPFTNANPPVLVLRVDRAIKGCCEGEVLEVSGWQETNDIIRASHGFPLPDAEIRASSSF